VTDDAEDYIMVAPSGLICDEVTASSLLKISLSGEVIDAGSTGLSADLLSLSLHSALYASPRRTDVKSVIHITSTSAVSVRTFPHVKRCNCRVCFKIVSHNSSFVYVITFHASRRRREMYIGHVCLCVCLSVATFPHYCTDPDVSWGNCRGCPLVVHCWADLQLCSSFIAMTTYPECEMSASACTRCMPGLNLVIY